MVGADCKEKQEVNGINSTSKRGSIPLPRLCFAKVLTGLYAFRNLLVLGIVPTSGPFGTVPELLFEKKKFIPELQRLLVQAENTS